MLGWVNRGWGIGQTQEQAGTAPPSFRVLTQEAGRSLGRLQLSHPLCFQTQASPFASQNLCFLICRMGTTISTSLFGRCVVISSGQSPQANSAGLILALPLTDCVTWGFHFHFSVPQFPHL